MRNDRNAFEPQINVAAAVLVEVKVPEFDLVITAEVDDDDEIDYVGVFDHGTASSFDLGFHGPTPEHVIGLAHRYAANLTGGKPYTLTLDVDDDVELQRIPS
jgi:hypothetical protein